MTRRSFLGLAGGIMSLSRLGMADTHTPPVEERFLWLRRDRTGEEFKMVYARSGELVDGAYEKFCWMTRDITAGGKEFEMDPNLLDQLWGVQRLFFGFQIIKPINILSGYRTPRTNSSTEGAAKHSFHLKGQAIDFEIDQMDSFLIGTLAKQFQAGGVGFYRGKDFIHIDTGSFRTWTH